MSQNRCGLLSEPISLSLKNFCRKIDDDPLSYACTGGMEREGEGAEKRGLKNYPLMEVEATLMTCQEREK